ncbi:cobalt-precorrin-5B (C(1))-methyltransferase, partial [Desulfobulbus sp. US5]|nr:cobalt-precorrin-5B (C(1))-methyltransferase [Desulfobulbus sp. US5]
VEPVRLVVTISVCNGEELAEKTLNRRLGILGGLSILGTTGIVRPISAKAWTDTIDASMKVARAAGLNQVILSTGRTSEVAVQKLLLLPEEAQVMMGDYLEYALKAASRHGFSRIHLAGMWAKILKCALCIPQTHVRNGALEMEQAAGLLGELGLDQESVACMTNANTAREILQRLQKEGEDGLVRAVCCKAQQYAGECSGLPLTVYLVTSEDGVIVQV